MAGYELIDDYLEVLRPRIGWHRRRGDVDSELCDHLYSATEALERRGVEPEEAQRQVLGRFGDPVAVAAAFASTGSRGVALPTKDTQTAGRAAWAGAVAWLVVAAGMSGSATLEATTGRWEGGPLVLFMIATSALLAAGVMTVLTLNGLHQRHGGLGLVGLAGIAVAALGTAAGLVSWFIFGWGALLGAGSLLIAAAMLARDLAPRLATVLFGSAWWVGAAVYGLAWWLEIGPRDEWGDYPVATATGIGTGAILSAAGLFGLGRWLMNEQAQSLPAVAADR